VVFGCLAFAAVLWQVRELGERHCELITAPVPATLNKP
jgi:hypothetical protein